MRVQDLQAVRNCFQDAAREDTRLHIGSLHPGLHLRTMINVVIRVDDRRSAALWSQSVTTTQSLATMLSLLPVEQHSTAPDYRCVQTTFDDILVLKILSITVKCPRGLDFTY